MVEEVISPIAACSSVGHKDNRQLSCWNAGEGWLQPIFNLCRLQPQHLPNTPPAPKTRSSSCRWLERISYSHPLPLLHAEAGHRRSGWALLGRWEAAPRQSSAGRQRGSISYLVRNAPCASLSHCLAFTGRVSPLYPLKQKGLRRGKGENILISKDVV